MTTPGLARVVVVATAALFAAVTSTESADLQHRTIAAFERYVRATEAQEGARAGFLWVDNLPPQEQRTRRNELRQGTRLVERLSTRDGDKNISVPDGLVHHWLGAVFVPGATVEQATTLLQDYDHHAEIYRPTVAQSRLLARNGDDFRMFLRFSMTKVITVVVNSEHEAHFRRDGPGRVQARIYSTRIAQVDDAGETSERELPVGRDGGYLWRLNTYWRLLEGDGGLYVECESISLTRGIPFGFGWMIRPFVTSIPRESLEFTLTTTRTALAERAKRP